MKELRILDFKTGRVDADYVEQLRGYGYLALQQHPDADSVYACVIWVRDNLVDGYTWSRAELEAWWERAREALAATGMYSPGAHCGRCPRVHECPARQAFSQGLANTLRDVIELQQPLTTGEQAEYLLVGARMLKRYAEKAEEFIKGAVTAAGGTVPASPGWQLRIKEEVHRPIDLRRALPVLKACQQIPGVEALYDGMKLSKEVLEAVVKDNSGYRQGGRNLKELYARLEEAGALKTETHRKLELRRCEEPAKELSHEPASA